MFNADKLLMAAIAFAAFCLVSSAVYVFNDMRDAAQDAAHPVKHIRPIASGAITMRRAAIFALALATAGLAVSLSVNLLVATIAAAYIALNLAYTLWLKHKSILDCFCIAAGFVLRIYAGGAASGDPISGWLFLTIVAMSLFMAFGKRRGEMLRLGSNETRKVLQRYDIDFLKGMTFVCAGLSIVFYSLWAMHRGSNMIYTVPLIVFMVSKYLLLIHSNDSHGDPTMVILENKSLLVACGLYGVLTIVLLYFGETV